MIMFVMTHNKFWIQGNFRLDKETTYILKIDFNIAMSRHEDTLTHLKRVQGLTIYSR